VLAFGMVVLSRGLRSVFALGSVLAFGRHLGGVGIAERLQDLVDLVGKFLNGLRCVRIGFGRGRDADRHDVRLAMPGGSGRFGVGAGGQALHIVGAIGLDRVAHGMSLMIAIMLRVRRRIVVRGFAVIVDPCLVVGVTVFVVVVGLHALVDTRAAPGVAARARGAIAAIAIAATTAAAPCGTAVRFLFCLAVLAFLFVEQRLPVGDRNLVVVRVDFREGEEAVPVAAVFDERGLERGLYAGDFGEVDVAAKLAAIGGLKVKLFDPIAAHDHHPGFLRVGAVDKHLVGHCKTFLRRCATRPLGPWAENPAGRSV
jgi:hypothetical protein